MESRIQHIRTKHPKPRMCLYSVWLVFLCCLLAYGIVFYTMVIEHRLETLQHVPAVRGHMFNSLLQDLHTDKVEVHQDLHTDQVKDHQALATMKADQDLPTDEAEAQQNLNMDEDLNYVIFDAFNYEGGLEFLNNPERGWAVLVINADVEKVHLASCKSCQTFSHNMAKSYFEPQKSNETLAPYLVSKMAVYRYVLSRKAVWIYTTDRPVTVPYDALLRVVGREDPKSVGMSYAGQHDVFQPCPHVVDPFMWPGSGHQDKQGQYLLQPVSSASVFTVVDECFKTKMMQSLPDDRVLRMTNGIDQPDVLQQKFAEPFTSPESGHQDNKSRISGDYPIDSNGPMTFVSPGAFAAMDFNNVLVSRQTAWTLIASLPTQMTPTIPLNRAKIKYNLIVQRILWDTGTQIGFIPYQQLTRKTCTSCTIATLFDVIGSHYRTNAANWRCQPSSSIPDCLSAIVLDVLEEYFTDPSLPIISDYWVKWMKHGWIPSAERSPLTNKKLYDMVMTGSPIFYTPTKSIRRTTETSQVGLRNPFQDTCANENGAYQGVLPDVFIFRITLLVVSLQGENQEELIPLLEYQYGRFFQHIVYCSTDAPNVNRGYALRHGHNPVTIIQADSVDSQPYACVKAVVKMQYAVSGYLFVNHRVLANLWRFHNLNNDQIWSQGFSTIARLTNVPANSSPVASTMKENKESKAMVTISSLYPLKKSKLITTTFHNLEKLKLNPFVGTIVTSWLKRLEGYTTCAGCVLVGMTDIYHLPESLAWNFVRIMDILSSLNSPLEVMIPTAMAGLADDSEIVRLPGHIARQSQEAKYHAVFDFKDKYFRVADAFTLAKKWYADFYCQDYLPRLDDDLKQNALVP